MTKVYAVFSDMESSAKVSAELVKEKCIQFINQGELFIISRLSNEINKLMVPQPGGIFKKPKPALTRTEAINFLRAEKTCKEEGLWWTKWSLLQEQHDRLLDKVHQLILLCDASADGMITLGAADTWILETDPHFSML
jgi:hypothetical protein